MNGYILQITHRYGVGTTLHSSNEAARRALAAYVLEFWRDDIYLPVPADEQTRITDYFANTPLESYTISQHVVSD